MSGDWIAAAVITRPQGLRGAVRARLFAGSAEFLEQARHVRIGDDPERSEPSGPVRVVHMSNGIVLEIDGCSTRDDAELLRNKKIFVPAPVSAGRVPGTEDVIGCSVQGPDGRTVGEVRTVYAFGGHDVWGIWTGVAEVMVPAVEAWVEKVDVDSSIVVLRSLELFEDS